MECHWGEFVPCCRHGQCNEVFFLCVVCVDAVYLPCFQAVALFSVVISVVFHGVLTICRLQQMYVLFTRGFWLGRAAKCSVASSPTLSLPLGSPPWLFLLRGTCPETDSGEVVVNSTLLSFMFGISLSLASVCLCHQPGISMVSAWHQYVSVSVFAICRAFFSKGEVPIGLRTKSRFQAPALVSFVCGLSS